MTSTFEVTADTPNRISVIKQELSSRFLQLHFERLDSLTLNVSIEDDTEDLENWLDAYGTGIGWRLV